MNPFSQRRWPAWKMTQIVNLRGRDMTLQFLLFAAVGAIGTIAHYSLLIALVQVLEADPVNASAAGASLGALLNYLLNYRYTFRSRQFHRHTAPRFFFLAAVGLGLNTLLMAIGVYVLRWNYLLVQLLATCLVLFWNFLGNRLWTFRSRKYE